VDDIRQLIEQVRIPPQYGKYKVYIIDEVHMLSQQAFNAFLKTLEEPPNYAIFILATTEKHKIIPTILSRCQIFDFNRIRNQDIAGQLEKVAIQEGLPFEPEALMHIARKADGGMRDALSMFDMISTFASDRKISLQATLENLHILDSDYYFRVLDFVLDGNTSGLLLLFDEVLRKGFDGHHFLLGLAEHIRNIILATDPGTHELLEAGEELLEKIKKQSNRAGSGFFLNLLSLANQSELQYKNSRHPRLLTELCLMKMANLKRLAQSEKSPAEGRSLAYRNPEASIRVVKEDMETSVKAVFRKTPSLRNPPGTEHAYSVKNQDPAETFAKKPLQLESAKAEYLGWYKEQGKGAVSGWSLAIREEQTDIGFRVFFTKGSISEDQFREEEPSMKNFFFTHYHRVPEFEIIQLEKEEQDSMVPYTNLDKFRYLAKKNPGLENLRSMLNLDFS
jgi:DNA polymerase-3 subunit gamma/tau